MTALIILKKDHQEVKNVLEAIVNSSSRALKTREKLMLKFQESITLHTDIEEKLIYPLALKDPLLESLTKEAYEEHNAVDMLLKQALKTEVADEYWIAKWTVIKENVEHHIKEEEKKMFPALSKRLSEEDLENIGKEILKFKEKHIRRLSKTKGYD